jgi:hypothetical protein
MKRLLKHGHDLLKKLGVKLPCCKVEAKKVCVKKACAKPCKKACKKLPVKKKK